MRTVTIAVALFMAIALAGCDKQETPTSASNTDDEYFMEEPTSRTYSTRITVDDLNTGVRLAGATVEYDAGAPLYTRPVKFSATTDANGVCTISFVLANTSASTYSITVTRVYKSGYYAFVGPFTIAMPYNYTADHYAHLQRQ